MMYFDFETNEQTYKLRLTTKTIMDLERKIGGNPLSIFGNGTRIPSVTEMVSILHYSLQSMQHNITFEKAASIFDNYLSEGHTVTDFIQVIVGVYRVSGIIQNEDNGDGEEKN